MRVIDFGLMEESEAVQFPVSYDLVRTRVKPQLGVGNDPVYTKTRTFDPFPFPQPEAELEDRI